MRWFLIILILALGLPANSDGPPICPHILGWPDGMKEWATGAPWIKVLDITSCGIAKECGARVFYRVWDHASGPDGDTKIGGRKFADEILERLSHLPKNLWPDAIGFQNEFDNVSAETAQCFIDMYDRLREGGYEGLIVFGSYGPGGPTDMTEWARPHIKAAVEKADAIETHEYWDLTVKYYDTWLAHRHVRIMNEYPYLQRKPWFIGEFGSDAVNKGEDPQNRNGWRDRDKLTADEYIRQIEIYRRGDSANGVVPCSKNVIAVFLFQQGSNQWEKWEVFGTKVADYMKTTWKPRVAHITGRVTDKNGKPVVGAKVTLSPSAEKTVTDSKGVYWFFSIPSGKYALKATKANLSTAPAKFSIKAGDIATKNLRLAP